MNTVEKVARHIYKYSVAAEARGSGRTTIMAEGTKDHPEALIVGPTINVCENVIRPLSPDNQYISISQVAKGGLVGRTFTPIVIDHTTVDWLIGGLLSRIDELERRLEKNNEKLASK